MLEQAFRLHRLAAVSGLCLGLAGSPALAAKHTFDGVYSGKRVLTKGSASQICPAKGHVSVTIHGDTLTFTKDALQGFIEPFFPSPDGSFGQTYYNGDAGSTVNYHGRIVGGVMDIDFINYAIAPCKYHWHLTKKNRTR